MLLHKFQTFLSWRSHRAGCHFFAAGFEPSAPSGQTHRNRPRAGEMSASPMYALLQIYPLEARGDDDPTPLDAIAVDSSQERLEEYLVGYQERYRAACTEFKTRDPNPDGDWASEHDCLSEAIMNRHAVYGALMAETTFKIVEVLAPVAEIKETYETLIARDGLAPIGTQTITHR
jgi:hypothetical protein